MEGVEERLQGRELYISGIYLYLAAQELFERNSKGTSYFWSWDNCLGKSSKIDMQMGRSMDKLDR